MAKGKKPDAPKAPVKNVRINPNTDTGEKALDDSELKDVAGGMLGQIMPVPILAIAPIRPLVPGINPLINPLGPRAAGSCTCSAMPSDPGRLV
jgi:hypothetical protein